MKTSPVSTNQRRFHSSHELVNLSLRRKRVGQESVYDVAPGTLGSHSIPFPRGDLKIGSMPPHMAIVGSSGAGKTILQKGFMQNILPTALSDGGLRYRAMVYDPKRELYPFLRAIGVPAEQIIVAHPFDLRSPAWDLAADFRESAQIVELSEMLIPKPEGPRDDSSGDFFIKTSRIIIQDLIHGFIEITKDEWALRDIVEAIFETFYLEQILAKTERGRRTWDNYFKVKAGGDTRLADNIRASLHTAISPFQTLAAVWHQATERFSLGKWLTGSGILLVGADPEREATLQQLNHLLFRRASQILLARNDENPLDLTWFFLDELREAGKLHGLRQILTQGRSKGARVVLGFQDIDGLRELYGDKAAEEIVGLCAIRIFLHLDNPNTREWVSKFFADEEVIIAKRTESTSGQDTGHSTSFEVGQVQNVLPVELHDLPLASNKTGVFGFFAVPPRGRSNPNGRPLGERGDFHLSREWTTSINQIGRGEITDEQDVPFLQRPVSHQCHIHWGEHDLDRLKIRAPFRD